MDRQAKANYADKLQTAIAAITHVLKM